MKTACFILFAVSLGCSNREPPKHLDQNDTDGEPYHIETEFWTNMPPPTEAEVILELDNAIGKKITINGGPHKLNGKPAIWIPKNTVIAVPDRDEWTGAPSHRSHIMVTGLLHKIDGQYELTKTSYEWLDQ